MKILNLNTSSKTQAINITSQIQKSLTEFGIKDGVIYIFAPHTTAGIIINEQADPTVVQDIINQLDEIAPEDSNYMHSEGNSSAHIKASLVGSSQMVIVEKGQLRLGTWQGIFFMEFDGPRSRKVYLEVVSK